MGYTNKRGRRPAEYASKSAHSQVIKDETIQAFLAHCDLPKTGNQISLDAQNIISYAPNVPNGIRHIIALDGGYTEVAVRTEFPSATICFFQFGALIFSIQDLEDLNDQSFIDPDDMAKLKNIQRLKLVLPTQNITIQGQSSLTDSIRTAIYDFFCQPLDDSNLVATLQWFLFQEYATPTNQWILASCPHCSATHIPLSRQAMQQQGKFQCAQCHGEILITDVFRLHEAIDDDLGASGIAGYVTTLLEQMILIHLIRLILKTKPSLLKQILFIKDGPLAFFGQTANMHKPMRSLMDFLFTHHDIFMAGLEKSGAFVEHADEIASRLDPGSILLLNNEYIYTYIIPGKADPANPYGQTTYYGNKVIFKTLGEQIYVVSLPMAELVANPTMSDIKNLMVILTNVEKLKCDMYDNALMPVALANKLVSLSNHPSSRILQKFAVEAFKH
ncbi:NurA domain-containing protein [Herpetosiphon gulosus]|uniref:NurA domain-containing protein n=1 Tax=Herpetosiphon gulosus TaxID=1973496 RepID=A0ABP9X813_9CHLR